MAVGLFIVLAVIAGVTVAVIAPSAPSVPSLGDPIVVRGDEIIKIRNTTKPPYYEMVIEEDFHTIFYYLSWSPGEYSVIHLSEEEITGVSEFRKMWCSSSVDPVNSSDESFVEVGVRCSDAAFDYSVKQGRVLYKELPDTIYEILRQAELQ